MLLEAFFKCRLPKNARRYCISLLIFVVFCSLFKKLHHSGATGTFSEMAASGNNNNSNDFTKALFSIAFYTTTCDVDFLFTLEGRAF